MKKTTGTFYQKRHIAKISRPKIAEAYSRQRLFALLDRYAERPVTWITGPPGAGKTTLAGSYIDARQRPFLWYSLDEDDTDIASFFYYLGNAIQPKLKFPLNLPLFTPEYAQSPITFAKRYFEKVFGVLRPPFTFVMDDYHEIPAESAFHHIMREFLEAVPKGITVFMISRGQPPPALTRLLARRMMQMITWEDLQFTVQETREVLKLSGRSLSEEELLSVSQKIGGWVAGLVLLFEGGGASSGTQTGWSAQGHERVFDYFAGEFFNQEQAETQAFLAKTALLPQVSPAMARELTGEENSEQILDRMYRQHFFTDKFFAEEALFRYHPLFKQFLLRRGRELFAPAEIRHLKGQAARLLKHRGGFEDVARLYHESDDHATLAELILEQAALLFSQGRLGTLTNWLNRLPEPDLQKDPRLLFWQGLCRQPFDPAGARAQLEKAFLLFAENKDQPSILLAWSAIVDTCIYEWNDFTPLDKWIDWFDAHDRVEDPDPALRVAMSMLMALMVRRPHHPRRKEWIEMVLRLAESSEDTNESVQALNVVSNFYFWLGDYQRAERIMEVLRGLAERPEASTLTVLTCKWLDSTAQLWVKHLPGEAKRIGDDSLALAEKSGVHIWDHMFFALKVNIALVTGDFETAEEYLGHIERDLQPGRRHGYGHYHYLLAWKYYAGGDYEQAERHCQTALQIGKETGYVFPVLLFLIAAAHVQLKTGNLEEASCLLADAESRNQEIRSRIFRFLLLLTRALLHYCQHDTAEGNRVLREAFVLGRRQQYYGTLYWFDSGAMGLLCDKALQEAIEPDYARRIVRLWGLLPPAPETADHWPWRLQIFTLGRFRLIVDGEPLVFQGKSQNKPLEMLKALIAFGGREVSKDKLSHELWGESDGDLGHSAFKTNLHRLRKLIGKEALLMQEGKLSLNPRYCWLDVWAYEGLLKKIDGWLDGQPDPNQVKHYTDKAMAIYGGHFLASESDLPWMFPCRDRLRRETVSVFIKIGLFHKDCGSFEKARDVFRKGIDIEPEEESLYQHLMALLASEGKVSEALSFYGQLCEALKNAHKIGPSAQSRALYRALFSRAVTK